VSDTQKIIACLYLPVNQQQLLLPNVSVAEVVGYQAPKVALDKPDYFLGSVAWRGINIPLISYEVANGKSANKISTNTQIAVINSIGEHHEELPFFAILTQGIPRLVKVASDLIKPVKGHTANKAEVSSITLDGEEAIIPDLSYLESLAFNGL
jgi:chemosensory pili system protein ChpC|tara:strand:+ start:555 stop:1013 length:459 start_codon:yes stop_codon:yes gene_type:complete